MIGIGIEHAITVGKRVLFSSSLTERSMPTPARADVGGRKQGLIKRCEHGKRKDTPVGSRLDQASIGRPWNGRSIRRTLCARPLIHANHCVTCFECSSRHAGSRLQPSFHCGWLNLGHFTGQCSLLSELSRVFLLKRRDLHILMRLPTAG